MAVIHSTNRIDNPTTILHIFNNVLSHVLTNNKNTMLQGIQKHVQCMSLKKGVDLFIIY